MHEVTEVTQKKQHTALAPVPGVVAIVEDDFQISEALGIWLQLHGLQATHHDTAESLLKAIDPENTLITLDVGNAYSVEYQLLGAILDLNLPGITGIDLAYSLRHLKPDLPIAIITALREEDLTPYGSPPSGIQCLKKPFDLDALEHALYPLLH